MAVETALDRFAGSAAGSTLGVFGEQWLEVELEEPLAVLLQAQDVGSGYLRGHGRPSQLATMFRISVSVRPSARARATRSSALIRPCRRRRTWASSRVGRPALTDAQWSSPSRALRHQLDQHVIAVQSVEVVEERTYGGPERLLSVLVVWVGSYVLVVDADLVQVALMGTAGPYRGFMSSSRVRVNEVVGR
jgi:hypothetical protein